MMNILFSWFLALSILPGPAPAGEASLNDVLLTLDISGREVRGARDAPVLLVEFSDYKCHACEKFTRTIMPEMTREFIETGKVAVTFVDFPLTDDALYTPAAEAVRCAGRQKSYWRMHDLLWEKVPALNEPDLVTYAGQMGLDVAVFSKCLSADEERPRVLADLKIGNDLGLGSRPTFFIGRRQPDRTWRGRYVVGAQSYLVFKSVIRNTLGAEQAK